MRPATALRARVYSGSMRKSRVSVVGGLAVFVGVVAACSSDATDTPPAADGGTDASTAADTAPSDSGTDTSTPTDAPVDSPTDAPKDAPASCSGVSAKGMVASFFTPQGQPALPITVEWDGCPQMASAVAASPFPTWTLDVGSGESYFRTKAAGYYTTNSQNVAGSITALVPSALVYVVKTLPTFDATKGHVIVSLNSVKASCAGATKAGSTVAAPGHPEAVITYLDKTGADIGGGGMSSDALALISNLDPTVSPILKPTITVAGGPCTMKTLFFTNTAAVVANTVTIFQAEAE